MGVCQGRGPWAVCQLWGTCCCATVSILPYPTLPHPWWKSSPLLGGSVSAKTKTNIKVRLRQRPLSQDQGEARVTPTPWGASGHRTHPEPHARVGRGKWGGKGGKDGVREDHRWYWNWVCDWSLSFMESEEERTWGVKRWSRTFVVNLLLNAKEAIWGKTVFLSVLNVYLQQVICKAAVQQR